MERMSYRIYQVTINEYNKSDCTRIVGKSYYIGLLYGSPLPFQFFNLITDNHYAGDFQRRFGFGISYT